MDPSLAVCTAEILERYQVEPDLVVFELTETAFIDDHDTVRENLTALRELGVGLALDDFGSGYSSLSHLRSVPLTIVKLDRQFVANVDSAGTDHEIVRNVIRLGHALGLRVVAEGVETASQRDALRALGCDAWQGFLRSPAVPVSEFDREFDPIPRSTERSGVEPMEGVGSLDSFVLRRIGTGRWAHLGGNGRGEGWAGILEVDEEAAPVLVRARNEGVQRVQHADQRWLVGPYHPRCAVVIPVDPDTVVIFGSMTAPVLPEQSDAEWIERAASLAESTTTVSPAKRLADELEMSEALQAMIAGTPETLDEAMRHVVSTVAGALSCEFGVLYLPAAQRVAFDDHTFHALDIERLKDELGGLAGSDETVCVQNADEHPFPLMLPDDFGVRSWIALPMAPALGGVLVCAHTDRSPRGFTTLCQKLGRRLADAAELVLYAGSERERLQSVVSSATVEARVDALTGLLNRRGWDDALAGCPRDDGPVSVVVADLNDLKLVNDTDGHAAGDALLVAAARCLSTLVRANDVVARIGGDEFAILMQGAGVDVCRRFVTQLAELVEIEQIDLPGLSIAAGCATSAQGEPLQATMAKADTEMYRHKKQQKDPAAEQTG